MISMLKKILRPFRIGVFKLYTLVSVVPDDYGTLYYTRSYSQEGEDIILQRVFSKLDSGFYVDVGAHHPQRISNTYLFYEKGWSGVNIDAMPGSMREFFNERPRDINLEVAIAREKKEQTFFVFNEPGLNSFDEELSRSRVGDVDRIIKEYKINTRTLAEVLSENIPANQTINFMSVDVEGLDLEVLQSNDWQLFRPQYVLAECFGMNIVEVQRSELCAYLESQGYEFFAKTANTVIFKDESCDVT